MLRYASGYVIAAIGGVASQVAADAVGASGIAAYGLFLAFVAAFAPVAAIVGGGPPSRGLAKSQR